MASRMMLLASAVLLLLLQLRKLVATQEDLQEQLAAQLAACQTKADAAAEADATQQKQLQQQLDEAQAAVAALAEELKVGPRGTFASRTLASQHLLELPKESEGEHGQPSARSRFLPNVRHDHNLMLLCCSNAFLT